MSRSRRILTLGLAVVGAFAIGAAGYGVADAFSPPSPNGGGAVSPALTTGSTIPANPEAVFVPVKACRIVNTYKAGGRIPAGGARSFYVVGSTGFAGQGGVATGCGIPASATAVSARVVALSPLATGTFAAYPTGTPSPYPTLYYAKGVTSGVEATLQLGAGTGKVLTVKNVNGPANLVIDVDGYFAPAMAGFVALDGSLQFSSGRVVATSRASTGNYLVTFDRDVSRCAFQVTPYAYNWAVAVGPQLGDANQAHVFIHEEGASTNPHDDSFFITATC